MTDGVAGTADAPQRARVPRYVPFFNVFARRLLRVGTPMGPNVLVTIRGRTSGQPRTTPLAIVEQSGRRWIWAPFGEVDWVRNLRAAGMATITAGRRTEEVTRPNWTRRSEPSSFATSWSRWHAPSRSASGSCGPCSGPTSATRWPRRWADRCSSCVTVPSSRGLTLRRTGPCPPSPRRGRACERPSGAMRSGNVHDRMRTPSPAL